jgi:uncharacterized membrane protein
VSKRKAGVDRGSDPADPKAADARDRARSTPDFLTVAATIGVVTAGVALLEVALVPGLVIGGAAVLAPRYLPKYLPKLRKRLRPMFDSAVGRPGEPAPGQPGVQKSPAAPVRLGIKQAVAKTITFRIIVTALDFTSNYVVIGEATTAAGLSSFAFVVGPIFYLVHETGWNYFSSSETVDLRALRRRPDAKAPLAAGKGLTISRALAKTITFRTIATVIDFTTIYVVVGDLATAAGLSAFGFVVGPFVYLGHEKAWDYFSSPRKFSSQRVLSLPAPTKLLPAPL